MTDRPLEAGIYLVATPIGSARDITLRALDVLAAADVIAAEDTRTARKLMEIHGVPLGGRPLVAYHDHSTDRDRDRLLTHVAEGRSVAVVSEAGTPLLADPGFPLTRAGAEAGASIFAVPGASALLAALSVAGLPTDRFLFAGFPPVKPGARGSFFDELATLQATLVFYEAPKRMSRSVEAMAESFGHDRPAAICRELTKRFEQTMRGTLGDLSDSIGSDIPLKGEFVVVVGPAERSAVTEEDLDRALRAELKTESVRDAATRVSEALGLPRKDVYARALTLK